MRNIGSLTKAAASLTAAAALALGAVAGAAPVQAQATQPDRVKYVALGDSFTSSGSLVGMGTGLDLGTFGSAVGAPSCWKSTDGYPRQLAAMTGWELHDVSCRGARIPLLYETTRQYGPAQIDAVTADTDIVTVQIGGNDTNVLGLAQACMFTANCTGREPEWSAMVPRVAGPLNRLIDDIQARAPHAQVIMVGYLQPFPEQPCVDIAPFSAANQGFFRRHIERLNEMLRGVAQQQGVALVGDVTPPGHSGCDRDRWTSFLGIDANAVPVHPTHTGHTGIANMIREAARV